MGRLDWMDRMDPNGPDGPDGSDGPDGPDGQDVSRRTWISSGGAEKLDDENFVFFFDAVVFGRRDDLGLVIAVEEMKFAGNERQVLTRRTPEQLIEGPKRLRKDKIRGHSSASRKNLNVIFDQAVTRHKSLVEGRRID